MSGTSGRRGGLAALECACAVSVAATPVSASTNAKAGYATTKKKATTKVDGDPAIHLEPVSTLAVHTGTHVIQVMAQRLCPSPACPSQRGGDLDVQPQPSQAAEIALDRL